MHDWTKLPKWAQDEIYTCQQRVADLEDALSSREYASQYEGDEPRVFLRQPVGNESHEKAIGGSYTTVVFRTPTDCVEVSMTSSGGLFHIRASGGDIAIHPVASNAVFLTGKEW
jgi:hypothetical protein